jgi:mRNA interferase HigB
MGTCYDPYQRYGQRSVRILARRTLREFVETLRGNRDHKAVKSALDSWFHEVQHAAWQAPTDVTGHYANASIVSDRVVFNIKGNSYRLVVAVDYPRQIVFIKWIGSHAAYDKIDVKKVKYGN